MSFFRPLLGHVLVDVTFVEGPPGSAAALTSADQSRALVEVFHAQHLLRTLATGWGNQQSPPVRRVCWFTVIWRTVRLDLDPTDTSKFPPGGPFSKVDETWLMPALDKIPFPTTGGVLDRFQQLRRELVRRTILGLGVADACSIFITNYPSSKHAQAPHGHAAIIPWTAAFGLNPRNMDGLIAHEMGHVFDAPDEYGHCLVEQQAGFFDDRNPNCKFVVGGTNPGPRVPCIMDEHAHALCSATPRHWGWVDDDHDGVADLMAPATVQNTPRPVTAGTPITISGRNVWDAKAVVIGPAAVAGPFEILSKSSIVATVPVGVSGTVDIAVLTRAGMSTPAP